jgi:hypothetical protein
MDEPANMDSSSLASSRRRCPAENSSVNRAALMSVGRITDTVEH